MRAHSSATVKSLGTWPATTRSDSVPVPASGSASFRIARTKSAAGDACASAPGVVLVLDWHACPPAVHSWLRGASSRRTPLRKTVAPRLRRRRRRALWQARSSPYARTHTQTQGVFGLRVLLIGLARTSGGGGAHADSKHLWLSVDVSKSTYIHYQPLNRRESPSEPVLVSVEPPSGDNEDPTPNSSDRSGRQVAPCTSHEPAALQHGPVCTLRCPGDLRVRW